MQWRSRLRAHCLGDASSTPASARPQSAPARMRRSTRSHKEVGSTSQSWCISFSAATVTHATPSTSADVPTMTQKREPAVATTLIVADATTVARTEAQALACWGLRPSADTSSTLPSHQGTSHQPISQSTLGKQTPDYGSKTIGLPAKPVVWIMMTSLSATFHCSWPIRHGHGWNTSHPTESKVGRI